MLILTRSKDQDVQITCTRAIQPGETITVRVCEVDRGQVRLGCLAPSHVIFMRPELGKFRRGMPDTDGNR